MTVEEHTDKAIMTLDNTYTLYLREMAIFNVYYKRGEKAIFERQLKDFSDTIIAKTNLVESADPHMNGETAEKVAAKLVDYMRGEYWEFAWNHDHLSPAYDVKYQSDTEDGEEATNDIIFTGSANACFVYILKAQGQSVDYAIKYGGYSIVPRDEAK